MHINLVPTPAAAMESLPSAPSRRTASRLSLTAIAMGVQAMTAYAQAEQDVVDRKAAVSKRVEFDTQQLLASGLDPALAHYFAEQPRFSPGFHRVALTVNNVGRGSVPARFDQEGRLCFDAELIRRAGLVMPGGLQGKALLAQSAQFEAPPADAAGRPDYGPCYDYREAEPHTEIDLDPGRDEVRLFLPAGALIALAPDDSLHQGGAGALMNYNLLA